MTVTKPIVTYWCNDTIEDDIDNDADQDETDTNDLDETDRTGTVTIDNSKKAVKLELENVIDQNSLQNKVVNEVNQENNQASDDIENLKGVLIDEKPAEFFNSISLFLS